MVYHFIKYIDIVGDHLASSECYSNDLQTIYLITLKLFQNGMIFFIDSLFPVVY